jgi:hypothetical protein
VRRAHPRVDLWGDPEVGRDGRVTDEGLGGLRSSMPHANFDAFDADRRLSVVPDLFTVGLVARYIAWKLGQDLGTVPGVVGAPHAPFPQEDSHER